jgi:hypothetical protein
MREHSRLAQRNMREALKGHAPGADANPVKQLPGVRLIRKQR